VLAAGEVTPIRKARVTLSPGSDDRDPVLTDDEGRFQFSDLPAGRYSVRATKAGFAPTTFGARRFLDRSTPILVTSGAVVDRIDIRMPRGAAITGRVLDDLGDPIVDVTVSAGRVISTDGHPSLASAASAQTDDLGEYRLSGLDAGRYIVKTGLGTVIEWNATGSGWPSMYFPSTPSLSQAQSVPVRAGEEMSAIDFQLSPMVTPTVTVGVTDALGQPARGAVNLVSMSTIDATDRTARLEDGYAWAGAPPGDYVLVVRARQGVAIAPLTVGSDDVSISLVTKPAGRMSGRVVYEGTARARAAGLALEAIAHDEHLSEAQMMRATATINRDDSFTLPDLIGARLFRVRGAGGLRLKSLTIKGQSLLDGPVTFAGGENWTDVVAVVTDEWAELRGTVVNGTDAVTDYSVLVFPEDHSRWSDSTRWLRWVRPNQTGAFTVDDLPSGRYLAIAVTDVDGATWSSEAYLDSIRSHATPFVLAESGTTTLALRLVVSTP
jgi:hypothetical protein